MLKSLIAIVALTVSIQSLADSRCHAGSLSFGLNSDHSEIFLTGGGDENRFLGIVRAESHHGQKTYENRALKIVVEGTKVTKTRIGSTEKPEIFHDLECGSAGE